MQHKIGTKVVFTDVVEHLRDCVLLEDVTMGETYTIAGIDDDGEEYFIDDAGEQNYAASTGSSDGLPGDGVYEVVSVPCND